MTLAAIAWGYRFAAQPAVQFGVGVTSETVTLATSPGVDYYVTGDGQADDLLALLEAAMEAHGSTPAITPSMVGFTARFATGGVSIQLEWTHANTTLDPAIFGWTASADSALAATITSPNQVGGLWRAGAPPMYDSRPRQPVIGGVARTLRGDVRASNFGTPYKMRELGWHLLPQEIALEQYATTTAPKSAFESCWLESLSRGHAFRYYPDEDDLSSGSGYTTMRISEITEPLQRDDRYLKRWTASLRALEIA